MMLEITRLKERLDYCILWIGPTKARILLHRIAIVLQQKNYFSWINNFIFALKTFIYAHLQEGFMVVRHSGLLILITSVAILSILMFQSPLFNVCMCTDVFINLFALMSNRLYNDSTTSTSLFYTLMCQKHLMLYK